MDRSRQVKISKYLSKHLRHEPDRFGLTLAPGGWVAVDALLEACRRNRFPISRAELEEVVAQSGKQRFAFDPTGTQIRANQGHSVEVDLQLQPVVPPPTLYHGSAVRNVDSILRAGLNKGARHHVHLSGDVRTAVAVGSRHGKPVVFVVDAAAMHRAGFVFYRSAIGVWLVDQVPPEFLRQAAEG